MDSAGAPEVTTRSLVAGGAAIATADDGRVVLAHGALPGERVRLVEVVERRRMITGWVGEVVDRSPHRVSPPCPLVARGCGGCDLQFADPAALPEMKTAIVADALAHLGGIPDARVTTAAPLPPWGYRTTVRAVADAHGRLGLRRRQSHELVALGHCMVAHPGVDEVLGEGRFPAGAEVVVRASQASGERLVVVDASPDDVDVPAGVSVVGREETRGTGWLSERVAQRWWRISGTSFFQSRPDGAEVLVAEVLAAIDELTSAPSGAALVSTDDTLVDAYAGVGLFAGAVRDAGWAGPVVAVERHGPATLDAEVNLAGDDVVVVTEPVEQWSGVPAGLVVADPARSGLGQRAVEVLAGTGASAVVLVSCDAAALGRDVKLLGAFGFAHRRSVVVDLFPHTHHVEAVTLMVRS